MSTIVKLSKPLTTHKGEVTEIELNEPTARSFVRHGEPFKTRTVNGEGEIDFANKEMMAFLADMSGIDAIILEALPAVDYFALRNAAVLLIWGTSATGVNTENPTVS